MLQRFNFIQLNLSYLKRNDKIVAFNESTQAKNGNATI